MDMTKWIILGVVIVGLIVAAVLFFLKRQKSLNQGFEQLIVMLKQVPNQKKQGFILLTFLESIKADKNKKANAGSKMNDQKYMEVQLLQMNMILKDRTKAKDKKTKRALQMYDTFIRWEKSKTKKVASGK